VAVEIMILCLRPLPAANGGWNSAKWRTPKLAAPVSVRPIPLTEWLTALAPPARADLQAILTAPFVAALRLEAPATAFETALAYAGVVAEACAGVVILGDEFTADRRASIAVWSGPQIEDRWRAIDAEAARAEPGYQPVRDLNDDHRPTQSFAFPIVLDGLEITTPTSRALYDATLGAPSEPAAAIAPAEGGPAERRAAGSAPPPASERRITVSIPPLSSSTSSEPAAGNAPGPPPSPPPFDAPDHEKTYDSIAGNEDDWSDVMPE
jgi:hypothetical protein